MANSFRDIFSVENDLSNEVQSGAIATGEVLGRDASGNIVYGTDPDNIASAISSFDDTAAYSIGDIVVTSDLSLYRARVAISSITAVTAIPLRRVEVAQAGMTLLYNIIFSSSTTVPAGETFTLSYSLDSVTRTVTFMSSDINESIASARTGITVNVSAVTGTTGVTTFGSLGSPQLDYGTGTPNLDPRLDNGPTGRWEELSGNPILGAYRYNAASDKLIHWQEVAGTDIVGAVERVYSYESNVANTTIASNGLITITGVDANIVTQATSDPDYRVVTHHEDTATYVVSTVTAPTTTSLVATPVYFGNDDSNYVGAAARSAIGGTAVIPGTLSLSIVNTIPLRISTNLLLNSVPAWDGSGFSASRIASTSGTSVDVGGQEGVIPAANSGITTDSLTGNTYTFSYGAGAQDANLTAGTTIELTGTGWRGLRGLTGVIASNSGGPNVWTISITLDTTPGTIPLPGGNTPTNTLQYVYGFTVVNSPDTRSITAVAGHLTVSNGIITGDGSGLTNLPGGGAASAVDDQNAANTADIQYWCGTLAEYNMIATPDPDIIYYITDDNITQGTSDSVAEINATSTIETIRFWSGTGAEYDALTPEADVIYYVTDR